MEPLDVVEFVVRVFCVWFVVAFGLLIAWIVLKEIGFLVARQRIKKELAKYDSSEE